MLQSSYIHADRIDFQNAMYIVNVAPVHPARVATQAPPYHPM